MEPTDPRVSLDYLDAWERTVERWFEPYTPPFGPDRLYMDTIGRGLGALERDIEDSWALPPVGFHPQLPPPDCLGAHLQPQMSQSLAVTPVAGYPRSNDPPVPVDPGRLPWVALEPAAAARPHITRDGIGPPAYQSRGGGGAGRHMTGSSIAVRVCPENDELVSEEANCRPCGWYRGHDGSRPICGLDEEEAADYEQEEP